MALAKFEIKARTTLKSNFSSPQTHLSDSTSVALIDFRQNRLNRKRLHTELRKFSLWTRIPCDRRVHYQSRVTYLGCHSFFEKGLETSFGALLTPSPWRRNNVSNRFTFRLLIAKLIPLTLDVTSPDRRRWWKKARALFYFSLETFIINFTRTQALYSVRRDLFSSESFRFFFASRSTYFDWCLIHFQKFEASW